MLLIQASGSARTRRLIRPPSTGTHPNPPSYAVDVGVVVVVGEVVPVVVVVGVVVVVAVVVSVVDVVGVEVGDEVRVVVVVCEDVGLVVWLLVCVVVALDVIVLVTVVVVVGVDVCEVVAVVIAHVMSPEMYASTTAFTVSLTPGPTPGCPVDRISPAQLTTAASPAGPLNSVSNADNAVAAPSQASSSGAPVLGSTLTTTPCLPTRSAQPSAFFRGALLPTSRSSTHRWRMEFSTATCTSHAAKSLGGTAKTVSPVSPTAAASNHPANAVVVGDVVTEVVGDGVGVMVPVVVSVVVGVVDVVEVGVLVGVVRSQPTNSPAAYAVIIRFSASTVAGHAVGVDTKCWY